MSIASSITDKTRLLLSIKIIALAILVPFSARLQAQTFAPVPALSFTKPFAGIDPLPQTLTIASVGAAFNYTRTSSTFTGGAWLSLSNVSWNACALCATPTTITVTVNPIITLAPGSYSGQIVFTSQNNATSLTVPVTLTVAGVPGTFLDNLPGQLSFSLKTGRTTSTSQDIPIRNGGIGSLGWTLTKSTSDGGNWLTVAASAGTAPSLVTASVTVANLPGGGAVAGTFIGQLVIQTAVSNTTIPVSVVVGDNIISQVNGLSFTKVFGGANPLPQTLTVASTGTSFFFTRTWSTGTGGNWLSVDNVSWNNCALCATPATLSAIVNADPTLAVGTYTGQIVLTSQVDNLAITVPVTLTVAPVGGAFLDNLAGQMSFSLKTGGAVITGQDLQVRNGGSGALAWTVTGSTSDGGNWLTFSPPSGSAPSLVNVGVLVANLPSGGLIAGTFIGELVFQTSGGSVTVPISVVVGDGIFNQINGISFTKVFGGANPLPQTLSVPSNGPTFNFTRTWSTSTGGNWLSVANVSWNNCALCATPATLSAIVNADPTLAVGTYTGQIVLTSQADGIAITVPVTLTVAPVGGTYFDNLPGQISFSLKTLSSTNPPAQSLQIRNGGTGTLSWTLAASTSDAGNWLSVSGSSGTAPSTVNVTVSKQNLPGQGLVAGTFIGNLVFRASGGSITVPVVVVVGDGIFSQVNGISFTKVLGGANPLPQTLTIASNGPTFNFTRTSSTSTGGNWLSVDNVSWSNCTLCAAPTVLTAIVNASPTLAVGTYTGQIVLTSQADGMAITVPVTLTVAPPTGIYFDNVPGQMSFSILTASGNPPTQDLKIRSAGLGVVSWTVTPSTSDNGNWLNVSAPIGSAPSTVTVSINASNLPNLGLIAGTFTGQLLFQSAGGDVTIPVSVVVGSAVFVQLSPISFTKSFAATNPLPLDLIVASTGTSFNFTVNAATATGGNWLSVSTAGACVLCPTPRVITATITAPTTLVPGTYTGQIVATAQTGSMAMTIPVTLTVATYPDFNIDQRTDVIWQDPVTGLAQVWYLGGSQGTAVTGAANLTNSNPWRIVGVGDFNQDGHPDVVWQDPASGAAQVWFLGGAGGNVVIGAAVLSFGNAWRIMSVADFNGDGHPDCIWQDPVTGLAQIWFFGGLQGVVLQNAINLTASNTWRIAGTGDFNSDGVPDVLWQDPVSGGTQVWYLGGAQGNVVVNAVNLSGPNSSRIVSIADFNKDGHPDVIWQDPSTGVSQAWFLGGAQGVSILGAASFSGNNAWRIAGPK